MAEATETYEKFAPVLESLNRNILFMASTLESVLNLTNGMYEIQNKQLVLAQENAERLRREADFAEVDSADTTSATVVEDDEKEPELKDEGFEFSFADILKALALAPFAFKFAKGFISGITDGLIEVTAAGITGLAALIRNPINNAFARIAASTSSFAKMLRGVGKFISTIFNALPGSGVLKTLLGKLAWPITLVLGAVDAVQAFINTEGDMLDKIGAGLGAFAASIVGGVLDLLKGIVAWVANKLGFENFANALGEFSFSDMIKDIFTYMFDGIRGAINVVKDLFTFGEGDMTALGMLGKLTDIVYAPVNMAINFVRGLFGFEDTGEPFKLQDWITEKVNQLIGWFTDKFSLEAITGEEFSISALFNTAIEKIKDFFADLFDFLPSIDDVKDALLSAIPERVRNWLFDDEEAEAPEVAEARRVEEERQAGLERRQEIESEIAAEQARVDRSASGENEYWGNEEAGREESEAKIRELQQELATLPQPEESTTGQPQPTPANQPTVRVMTTDGFKDLTREEIEAGIQDGSIKRSIGRQAQRSIESETGPTVTTSEAAPAEVAPEESTDRPTRYDRMTRRRDRLRDRANRESGTYIAGERFVEGGELTDNQRAAVEAGLAMGNTYEPAVMEAYNGNARVIPNEGGSLERRTQAVEQGSAEVSGRPAPVVVTGGNSARGGDTYNNGGNTNTTTIINQSSDPVRALRHVPM